MRLWSLAKHVSENRMFCARFGPKLCIGSNSNALARTMQLENFDREQLYRALLSRDARFDGRFFVGVTSTGIYCRPVCRVRAPKPENCLFFATAMQAEAANFRPCLRCRPENAPGWSTTDASGVLAHQAVRLIEQGVEGNLAALSRRLGVTDRHLRRLFKDRFGVTPGQYLRTRRLLLAKSLLTDTQLPVIEVAKLAGFGSLSGFHQLFKACYRMSPARLRQSGGRTQGPLRFKLSYRPPFDWSGLLGYLSVRAIEGIEAVIDGAYCRSVAIKDARGNLHEGWLMVSSLETENALELTLSDSLAAVIPKCLARVRAMFDLDADPGRINQVLKELSADCPGLRIPGSWDGFEMACRAVLGQLISVRAATTLAGRLAALAELPITSPWPSVYRRFPLPDELVSLELDQIGQQGITRRSIEAMREIAIACLEGRLDLTHGGDPAEARRLLLAVRGVGEWTSGYVSMRVFGWPDAFLAGDLGVRKALGEISAQEAAGIAERWRPWRSYAVMHLWRGLA